MRIGEMKLEYRHKLQEELIDRQYKRRNCKERMESKVPFNTGFRNQHKNRNE